LCSREYSRNGPPQLTARTPSRTAEICRRTSPVSTRSIRWFSKPLPSIPTPSHEIRPGSLTDGTRHVEQDLRAIESKSFMSAVTNHPATLWAAKGGAAFVSIYIALHCRTALAPTPRRPVALMVASNVIMASVAVSHVHKPESYRSSTSRIFPPRVSEVNGLFRNAIPGLRTP
jgi:hypothetical protein